MLLAAVVLVATGQRAFADWQVHRQDGRALLEGAERALREQPDDDAIARRLVRIAGQKERRAVIARFRARAQGGGGGYAALAAYARLLLAAGDARAAAAAFDEALRAQPGAVPALVGRARSLAAAGAAKEAIAAYEQALGAEHHPPARRRLIEDELAILAGRGGEPEMAQGSAGLGADRAHGDDPAQAADPAHGADPAQAAELARVVELRRELCDLDPDRDGAAARLADALERAGRPLEAAAALEARVGPGRAFDKLPLALRAARLRVAAGRAADAAPIAARLIEMARQLPAGDTERRREVWSVALLAARRAGTVTALAAELAKSGDRAGAPEWDLLGQVRDELGDLEGALAATRAAVARAPRDADVAHRLVALFDRLGREEEATAEAAALSRRLPDNPRLVVELVDRQMRRGRGDEAGAALDRAIARFARDRGALLDLATVASRWGDDQRALGAWQRLCRLDPGNEVAIIGLGEAQFQGGHKDEARRTWAALRDRQHGSVAGRLRFAEVLLEHDFILEATAEARRAQAESASDPAPHRLLAQVFEREKKIDDAVTEWNAVLALAGDAANRNPGAGASEGRAAATEGRAAAGEGRATAGEGRAAAGEGRASAGEGRAAAGEGRASAGEGRATAGEGRAAAGEGRALAREARVRLLALYARQGRGRLEGQIRKLAEAARAHPEDAEAALFLAEAQQRAGDTAGAMATLRELIARAAPDGAATRDAAFDVVVTDAEFALVHLLKRGGQLDEATAHLQEIGRRSPGRARDAELQLAELELARYDTAQALAHAARAATGADGPMLARIADLESRAGDPARATASYRAAVTRGAGPVAALALIRLLERSGDTVAAAGALDDLFRLPDDDEAVTEAGRLAIDLGELAGTLPDLEQRLAERLAARDTPARRRLLVTLLKRLLPPLYRDPAADGVRARLAPHALRALLDLVTSGDQPADPAALELVGMLGNADATPAIARLLSSSLSSPADAAAPAVPRRPRTAPATRADGRAPQPVARRAATGPAVPAGRSGPEARMGADARLSAVLALGRLGDPRGRAVLERLVTTADPNLRAATVWALGRIPGPRSRPLLLTALQDRRAEVVMAAALGLGRLGDADDGAALCRLAADGHAPVGVRRAAIVALGRTASRRTTAALFGLVDRGDDELARAAALALAWSQDPAATDGLLARALLPRSFALGDAGAPLAGLDAVRIGAGPPDEARTLPPAHLDLDAVLAGLVTPPPHGDLTPLVHAHAGALVETLARALAREGDARGEAAAALDGLGDGLGLGALAEVGDGISAPDAAATVREIVLPLADRLAPLLDAPEPETRAAALRVLARLGDERVTPARVAAAARDTSPLLAGAAAFAAGQMARARPGTAPQLAAALAPALADESWRRRLAAVDALAALGPAGLPALERARADGNSIIRAAADEARRRPRGD